MKYVIVGIYHTYIDAHLSMGMLEDANISCVLKDENTVSIYPGITNAVGGIKLMVAEAQKERAIEILASTENETAAERICPDCGSSNIECITATPKNASWLSAIAHAVLGSASDDSICKMYHCLDCGNEFE